MAKFIINTNCSGMNNSNLDTNGANVHTVNGSDNKSNREDIEIHSCIINTSNIRTASVYDICHPLVM